MGNPIKKEGQTDQAVLAGEKIEKEPPPQLPQEGKPLLGPEEKPSLSSLPETSSSTVTHKPPFTPDDLLEKIKRDAQLLKVSEKEPPTTSIEGESTTKKVVTEPHPTMVTEGESVAVVEKSSSSPPDKGPVPNESPAAEAGYLAPTKDFKLAPAGSEKESITIIAEEERPATGELTGAVGIEGPPERITTERGQSTAPPVTEEKVTPSAASTEKPPVTGVSEKHPPATPEEKLSPAVQGEKPTPAAPAKDLRQSPEIAEKESPPVIAVEEKLPIKEDQPAPEAGKPHERPTTIGEQPHIVVENKESPVVEEKDSLTVVVEKEALSPSLEEGLLPAVAGMETPLAPAGEGVEPPIAKLEELTTPSELVEEMGKEIREIVPTWEIWRTDPAGDILIAVAIVLMAAKVGGEIAGLLRLPKVVGKLIVGMILGNIYFLTGWEFFNFIRVMPFIKHLSYFGALTLLFSVGLQTDIRAMGRVGASTVLVALGAIIGPAGLGFLVGHFLLPDVPIGSKLVLSIILCCTSVGLITATLIELKAMNTLEGRIIIGSSVLADIIVYLAFGVVSGFLVRGTLPLLGVMISIGIVLAFLATILIVVLKFGERIGDFTTRRIPEGLKLPILAVVCLLLAFLATAIGLHAVIGAFAAGLLFRNLRLRDSEGREYSVDWLLGPAYMLLVPILFLRVGALVRWESFLDREAVFVGIAIVTAAVLGKMLAAVCPIEKGVNRLAVGLGVAPKLENTIVLAGISKELGLLDDMMFSSVVMAIIVSSTVCISLFKVTMSRTLSKRERLIPEEGVPAFHRGQRKKETYMTLKRLGLR